MRRILKGFSILLLGMVLIITSSAGTYAGLGQEGTAGGVDEPQTPGISIRLQRDEVSYKPGETLEYNTVVTNTGNLDLEDLKLDDLLFGEKTIESLRVGEELILQGSYEIPMDMEDEFITNRVIVTGEASGVKVEASDSFKAYMEVFSSIEDIPEDGEGMTTNPGEDVDIEKAEDVKTTEAGEVDPSEANPVSEGESSAEEDVLQGIEPMDVVTGGLEYYSDTEVLPLWMDPANISQNQHTKAIFTWMLNGDIYLAVISQEPVEYVTYNGTVVYDKNDNSYGGIVERALAFSDFLKVYVGEGKVEDNKGAIDKYGYRSPKDEDFRWSVIKIPEMALTSPFNITVKTRLGGGHSLVGVDVYIASDLQVYHQYDGGAPILDVDQSGSLNSDFSYSVHPEYVKDGVFYRLVRIERVYNGESQSYTGPENLVDGKLTDIVPTKTVGGKLTASAVITFVYELADDGELTVSKRLEEGNKPEDYDREFDIFISGPEGRLYVLTLKPGKPETITGLKYGTYTIWETVPMNFEVVGNSSISITLSKDNKKGSATITNKRTNDGWFYDDDEKKNNFTVGIGNSK